ncbi:MAG: HAD-superfamily hydrolase, subfamily IA, variant 3 [Parcubacteria group bacterium GW2011_GWC2_42_6]|nr:MAG: HAD-superfamily hydrolase, subfamily IA, variant 3 [Parcubacteria group bacterium GW2011_GWA2_42_11]KKS66544.1 MAG: HAD-superfamily hydrolase, subfamily IA, variant 3 [Parcubacteria group bacterium GW2011_GWC2_42_6]KKT76587.1 MAG: HAD-superfamily hydrolase, subfamily IA, variant 3 [Parcubacteria group bacterium GW2011_GWF2_44_7]
MERKRFGNRLAEEFNIPYEKILPFFKKEFATCVKGKADLKKEIIKYFSDWGWTDSAEALLSNWLSGTKANENILEIIDQLRENKINCYLVSDQEKYRAEYITQELNFKNRFDKCFFSCDLGFRKIERDFYSEVLKQIKVSPPEVVFWDDDEKNLNVAKGFGIQAELYVDFDDFIKKIRESFGVGL